MHKVERAIILAAGIGKRMNPVTIKNTKTFGESKWCSDD